MFWHQTGPRSGAVAVGAAPGASWAPPVCVVDLLVCPPKKVQESCWVPRNWHPKRAASGERILFSGWSPKLFTRKRNKKWRGRMFWHQTGPRSGAVAVGAAPGASWAPPVCVVDLLVCPPKKVQESCWVPRNWHPKRAASGERILFSGWSPKLFTRKRNKNGEGGCSGTRQGLAAGRSQSAPPRVPPGHLLYALWICWFVPQKRCKNPVGFPETGTLSELPLENAFCSQDGLQNFLQEKETRNGEGGCSRPAQECHMTWRHT